MKYLRPNEIKEIPTYDNWEEIEELTLNNHKIKRQKGSINQEGYDSKLCDFSKLSQIASIEEVASILKLAKQATFDEDPDSVDGMCSHEFYLDSPDIKNDNSKYNNSVFTNKIRSKLKNIVEPIINERINPYIRMVYPSDDKEHDCTPCYCFIRKYKPNGRVTHATHRDGHAFATVVMSLSEYGKDYRGGIYVATAERYKSYIALNKGDAIVHKHDLLHGVKVKNDGGERWSLIIWYKNSINCVDHSKDWYKEKAHNGEAVYQSLYANHAGGNDIIMWHKKAADQGFTNSMVKLARAYLKRLPSNLEFNPNEAERYYRLAIKISEDPHAQYGLAEMILGGLVKIETNSMMEILKTIINLLEESAKGGDVFAMFNLGIAHLYGYTGIVDMELAKDWFIYSNLPEGLYVGSLYYLEKDSKISNNLRERAKRLGFGTKWRQEARQHTGLGGAGGIDINLPWPEMPNGTKPERW